MPTSTRKKMSAIEGNTHGAHDDRVLETPLMGSDCEAGVAAGERVLGILDPLMHV